jgi:hypothetical protein
VRNNFAGGEPGAPPVCAKLFETLLKASRETSVARHFNTTGNTWS